jgi:hypothetical protein
MPALEHALTGSEVVAPSNSAFVNYFTPETANLYGVDHVPTHFPSDPKQLLSTTWSPPIFRELVETLDKTIQELLNKSRRVHLAERQEIVRMTPREFVKEILES